MTVNVISGAYTISSSDDSSTLVATGDSLYEIDFPAIGSICSPFRITLWNTSLSRAKRIKLIDSVTRYYFLWPGLRCEIANFGTGVWQTSFGFNGPTFLAKTAAVSGAVTLLVDPAGGDDILNDGLGSDAPLQTVAHAQSIYVGHTESAGVIPVIQFVDGAVCRENFFHNIPTRGYDAIKLLGNATWAYNPASGPGIQVRDGAILQVGARDQTTGTLRFVPVDADDNYVDNGWSIYASHMSVIDILGGVEFGYHPGSSSKMIRCEDAWMAVGTYEGDEILLSYGGAATMLDCMRGSVTIGAIFNIPVPLTFGNLITAEYQSVVNVGTTTFTGSGVVGTSGCLGQIGTNSGLVNQSYFSALSGMTSFNVDASTYGTIS
jgi:hypothetical protein